MKLVYETNIDPARVGTLVCVGDVVVLDEGQFYVTRIQKPHKPESTGRVYVGRSLDPDGWMYWRSFFPSVIGAHWIEREDQHPDA